MPRQFQALNGLTYSIVGNLGS